MKCNYGKVAPAFILLDEGALDRFFNKNNNFVDAKIFLEGNGIILENKMKHPKERWAGVPIILTSNVLPACMHKPDFLYENEKPY